MNLDHIYGANNLNSLQISVTLVNLATNFNIFKISLSLSWSRLTGKNIKGCKQVDEVYCSTAHLGVQSLQIDTRVDRGGLKEAEEFHQSARISNNALQVQV